MGNSSQNASTSSAAEGTNGLPLTNKVRFHVPVDVAQTPATGDCLCDHWWSVHPTKGLAFYAQLSGYARSEEPSPQCNQSESTARFLTARLAPEEEVRFFPVVFLRHAQRELSRLRTVKAAHQSEALGPSDRTDAQARPGMNT